MAQKRRHPRSRTRSRRSTWKAARPALVSCPQCKARILPHRVCPSCGYYGGREVVAVEAARSKKKKKES
ncbi:MAG: 50S ribosomal protein L32 [Armatimonadota bacterium]|nr:50S ribosomal protein L32 [Armatimonadota bacterium]MDR7422683.1 50S ribosomal protein L32 [Armatimonadota bacterium]MDR7453598.1 50S ribosomal protein L32 [Armatimonadota bacterium]MDR7456922.1 50S ribosomal protein L32 [Armatimonadota bacterium]MDR7496772.1 50S ribosomal protein L32 [Armatimonadota bacterium]